VDFFTGNTDGGFEIKVAFQPEKLECISDASNESKYFCFEDHGSCEGSNIRVCKDLLKESPK